MGFEKYGDVEELQVLRGREAQVLHEHSQRLGKYRVSDFTEKQKEALLEDLNAVREEEAALAEEEQAVIDEAHAEDDDVARFEDEGGSAKK
jgi:hypothetical protein